MQHVGRELCFGALPQAMARLPLSPAAGFLRKKDHEAAYGQGAVLEQGALLECVVMPGSKGRLVKVTTDPEAVAHTVTKDQERLNISELRALLLMRPQGAGLNTPQMSEE